MSGEQRNPEPWAEVHAHALRLAGHRVLLAGGPPARARRLQRLLAAAGLPASACQGPMQAVAAARRRPPALVVLDLEDTGDGLAACQALRADPALRDVPVLLLAPAAAPPDLLLALQAGADGLLRQPFEPPALLDRIRHLLANHALRTGAAAPEGWEVELRGQRLRLDAHPGRVFGLLFNAAEDLARREAELLARQRELRAANLQLATRAEDLQADNERLQAFASMLSHEMRSPLALIAALARELRDAPPAVLAPSPLGGHAAAIVQEAGRTARLAQDVLHFATITPQALRRQRVDLAAQAREVAGSLRLAHPGRQVRFDCVAEAPADCDPRLARLALANLLGNAWKFTRDTAGARVAFGMAPGPRGTVFHVRDNGAGFDMAQAHRLFQPLERLHPATQYEGSGLGLATVQRIMDLHGGAIRAEAAPGRGACFRFSFAPGALPPG